MVTSAIVQRCAWSGQDPLMIDYHDREWGVPVHDDRRLFEFLVLEAAQAGLSWRTILNKRENYRRALGEFDPAVVARYGPDEVARLLADSGIVRNRLKIEAAHASAGRFIEVQEEFGSFDAYVWRFVDGKPIDHRIGAAAETPARTEQSDAMSKDLKHRGFKFVGTTICYAFMQAVGMVNDHETACFRHDEID